MNLEKFICHFRSIKVKFNSTDLIKSFILNQMKKAIILFVFSILTCQMFAQSTGQGCVVNPSMVSPSGVKYTGGCLNGLAEGDGTITFSNGNTISGKFSKNILQDGIVEFYFNQDGAIAIGPYKNKKLNGRFVGIDRHQMKVWTSNYVDGHYVGNSDDYFNLPEPQIGETQTFPIFTQYSDPKYPFHSNFGIITLIPKTELALIYQYREGIGGKPSRRWLSTYDYRSNQSIRSFGDVNNPIETFLCFDADYSSFYAIQSRKNVKGVYKFNITSGASEFVSRVEDQKVLATSLLVSKSNGFNKYPGFEDGDIQYGEINHNLNLIFSWTNNGMFKLGNMKSTFLVSKLNGEKVNELSFDGAMVRSYAVNELTNKLYISFTSNELEYISLFKLDSLEYVKTIFKGEKNKGFWPLLDIKISPLGTYVAFSQSGSTRGTIIYKGDQFYYAVDGGVESFNNLENVVLSGSGPIFAHDLENKKILWTTNKVGWSEVMGTNPIKIDNDIIFITSPNASLAKSTVNKINFEMPDLTQTFFTLNEEVQKNLRMISEASRAEQLAKENQVSSQSSGTETNQTTSFLDIKPSQSGSTPNAYVKPVQLESVVIGSQTWSKKSLNVSNFRNGDQIFKAKSKNDWDIALKNNQPAWCCYDFIDSNCDKFGKIYNWYAVVDPRGVAPLGWHIPSENDWKILMNEFRGGELAKKLKSPTGWANISFGGTTQKTCPNCEDWNSEYRRKVPCHVCKDTRQVKVVTPVVNYSGNGTNATGFSALPGGTYSDGFYRINRSVEFWSFSLVQDKSSLIPTLEILNSIGRNYQRDKNDELHKVWMNFSKRDKGRYIRVLKD
jgi:hypothetical protein